MQEEYENQMKDGNLQASMIEEFQAESLMITENDESGLTPVSRQNINDIDNKEYTSIELNGLNNVAAIGEMFNKNQKDGEGDL